MPRTATPAEGYAAPGTATPARPANGYTGTIDGYAAPADGFDGAVDSYTRTDGGYGRAAVEVNGYDWNANGYDSAVDGYAGAIDGYDTAVAGYPGTAGGYAGAADDFAGAQDGFAGGAYLGPGSYTEYTEPGLAGPMFSSDPMLTAPDAGVYPESWLADQERRREASQRGPMVGALMELLATGVVIGVSTLAAALLKAQTSPVSAMGAVFIDRTPAALRNVAVQHFGAHGRAVLLLGMYAAFAVVAIVIGVLARRAAALGVAGIAAFTLFAAFAVITRPASHLADITPAIIGGIAGVAALLWLFRASAPVAPLRHARGARRRTR